MCIPLCIDYIIEKKMCEMYSLANFLQLDEGLVRKSLIRLKDHGLLESEEMKRTQFELNYAEKLGVRRVEDDQSMVSK